MLKFTCTKFVSKFYISLSKNRRYLKKITIIPISSVGFSRNSVYREKLSQTAWSSLNIYKTVILSKSCFTKTTLWVLRHTYIQTDIQMYRSTNILVGSGRRANFIARAHSPQNSGLEQEPPELPEWSNPTTTYFLRMDQFGERIDFGASLFELVMFLAKGNVGK